MQKIIETPQPFVSIIMNCYNGERYLAHALESILGQTYSDWELVFWDNCSTDESRTIVASYLDARIKYFLAPDHTDLGKARVRAMAQATGHWIGFLDVDDFWYPKKLELQIDIVKKSEKNVGLIYGRCESITVQGNKNPRSSKKEIRPRKRLPQGDISKEICDGNFLPSPSILYRATAIRECTLASSFEHAPDYYFTTCIGQKYSVKAVDEIICAYRKHSNNLSLEKEEVGYLEGLFIANLANAHKLVPNAHIARCIIYFVRKKQISRAFRIVKESGLYNSIISALRLVKFKRRY